MSNERVGSGDHGGPILTTAARLALALASADRIERLAVLSAEDSIEREAWDLPETAVIPDAAMCDDCVHEIENPRARRFGYAFTSCSRCGPRFSIVQSVAHGHRRAGIAGFRLCAQCEAEFECPEDRHFRARPMACPACGPRLWLEIPDGRTLSMEGNDAGDAAVIDGAQRLLREGAVLAIKGVGGFQLACDATRSEVVRRLRQRKADDVSAFPLMARNLSVIERYCEVGTAARACLGSPAAPIVVLQRRDVGLPEEIAPGLRTLGFMLPSTPLHHLLMARFEDPLVMTSGNRAPGPACTGNRTARSQLGDIADAFLMHDRDIVNRVDDSIVRVVDGAARVLRRARGYAPATLRMPRGFEEAPPILAMGGDLNNTFCLLQQGRAVLSAHQGDLHEDTTYRDYRRSLDSLSVLFEHTPECVAVDLDRQCLSAQLGMERARHRGVAVESVQHHHAHVASCLVDNGVPLHTPPVLAIVLEGLGSAREPWGGEVLVAGYSRCIRIGTLQPRHLDPRPWRALIDDLRADAGSPEVPARFHIDLAEAVARLARTLATEGNIGAVALSGDLFENATLFEPIASRLRDAGLTVLTHRQIPPNDGGLAIGQAAIVAARLLRRRR